jgi:DNA processing protein
MIDNIGKDELPLLLELNKISSFRSQFKLLRDGFSSLSELAASDRKRLMAVQDLSKVSITKLAEQLPLIKPGTELKLVTKAGLGIVTCFDEEYPKQLNDLPQPAPVIYVRGNIDFEFKKSLSIVGSRTTSPHGVTITGKLAFELGAAGFCIISGGARGIDSQAHRGALEGGGKTIAVMACGLDIQYPPENKALFESVVESGAVISEFPLGTPPEKYNFPTRNRIIAALSLGTLVIEAGDRSGALITAEHALEIGRDVFAVPGRPGDMGSRGANKLIRDGAFLVLSLSDILERFGLTLAERPAHVKNVDQASLTKEEREVLKVVDLEPMVVDEISRRMGKNVVEIIEPLISLQLKGLVKEMPGKSYVRTIGLG